MWINFLKVYSRSTFFRVTFSCLVSLILFSLFLITVGDFYLNPSLGSEILIALNIFLALFVVYFVTFLLFGVIIFFNSIKVFEGEIYFKNYGEENSSAEDYDEIYFFAEEDRVVWVDEEKYPVIKNPSDYSYISIFKNYANRLLARSIVARKGLLELSVAFRHTENPEQCMKLFRLGQDVCPYLESVLIDFINEHKAELESFDNPVAQAKEIQNFVGQHLEPKTKDLGFLIGAVELVN